MIQLLENKTSDIKQEFARTYDGSSNIQEVVPLNSDNSFPINKSELESLHLFADKNPIYYNSYEKSFADIPCMVYEGDTNTYWLNSIQHAASHAPFSPTWIISAYIISLQAKQLGYTEILDIGSGDGRIAYCAKIQNTTAYSIEIDKDLVNLQKKISETTTVNFNSYCSDASNFDYESLNLKKPAFFIGGLAKMGGDVLASAVIEKINSSGSLKNNACLVFAGTFSPKYSLNTTALGGWDAIIKKYNLETVKTTTLPTAWTFKESNDTPYIFAKFNVEPAQG